MVWLDASQARGASLHTMAPLLQSAAASVLRRRQGTRTAACTPEEQADHTHEEAPAQPLTVYICHVQGAKTASAPHSPEEAELVGPCPTGLGCAVEHACMHACSVQQD